MAKSFKVMVLVPSAAAIWLITQKPRSAMGDQSIRSVNIKATILPHLYVVIKHWYYVMEGTTRDAAVKRAMTGKKQAESKYVLSFAFIRNCVYSTDKEVPISRVEESCYLIPYKPFQAC